MNKRTLMFDCLEGKTLLTPTSYITDPLHVGIEIRQTTPEEVLINQIKAEASDMTRQQESAEHIEYESRMREAQLQQQRYWFNYFNGLAR